MSQDHNAPQKPLSLDIDSILGNPTIRIVVCCGSGGVGKTTTAAALALRAAEIHGRRTVVLTIDPARRLAQSLGLLELDNTPRQVKGVELGNPQNSREPRGELHAMMLDMKRTFDEIVLTHTDPVKAAEIFANPFYQAISSTFAGTQEYMAMEKLGQLHAKNEWDLIVVDTPPSRSALDFLDSPVRLARFLDGTMLRLLMAPARAGGHRVFGLVSASLGIVNRAVTRIVGTQLLSDLSGFVSSLDSMFGGFRERAEQTYRVLQADETVFLVVAIPEPDAVREATYFAERLATDNMPLAGLVLNRVTTVAAPAISALDARNAAMSLSQQPGAETTATVLALHAILVDQFNRQRIVMHDFVSRYPHVPIATVAAQPTDVHDLHGLRTIGTTLALKRLM